MTASKLTASNQHGGCGLVVSEIRYDDDIFVVRSKAETVSLIYRTVP